MTSEGHNETLDWPGAAPVPAPCSEHLRAQTVHALDAALNRGAEAEDTLALPPLRHWLYFHSTVSQADTGIDGHRRNGDQLPLAEFPRRMWAASDVEFLYPLPLDSLATRVSCIQSVQRKQGRHGPLLFVQLKHEITPAGSAEAAIVESQQLVYRGADNTPVTGEPATGNHDWEQSVLTNEVLLFRYSALTANAHRIHYDQPYATTVEGYPGLVVHGPLQATLLLDAWRDRHPGARIRRFSFRALAPSYVSDRLLLCGRDLGQGQAALWLRRMDGTLGMQAQVDFGAAEQPGSE